MKNLLYILAITGALIITGLIWVNTDIFAQDNTGTGNNTDKEKLPFIDRDGDGVNDLLQRGWGLKFGERQKNRQAVLGMLGINGKPELVDTDNDGKPDTPYIDTDNDGKVDTPVKEFMQNKMNQLIDTNKDGVPDTPLGDYIRQHNRTFDRDGDGIPDAATPEEIRQHMQEMKAWRQQIQERIKQGLPPFIDENGDGIPDNLPSHMQWRGGMHNQDSGKK